MTIPYMTMRFQYISGDEWTESFLSTAGDIASMMGKAGVTFDANKQGPVLSDPTSILYARAAMLGKGCTLYDVLFRDDSGLGKSLNLYLGLNGDRTITSLKCDLPFTGINVNYRSSDSDLYQTTRLIRGVPDAIVGGDADNVSKALFDPLLSAYHYKLGINDPAAIKALPPQDWGFKVFNRGLGTGYRVPILGITTNGGKIQFNTAPALWALGSKVRVNGIKLSNGQNINGLYTVLPDAGTGAAVGNGFVIERPALVNVIVESQHKVIPDPGLGVIFGFAYPQDKILAKFGFAVQTGESSKRCSSDIITRRRVRRRKKK